MLTPQRDSRVLVGLVLCATELGLGVRDLSAAPCCSSNNTELRSPRRPLVATQHDGGTFSHGFFRSLHHCRKIPTGFASVSQMTRGDRMYSASGCTCGPSTRRAARTSAGGGADASRPGAGASHRDAATRHVSDRYHLQLLYTA